MMVKRQLSEEERRMTLRNLKSRKEERNHIALTIEYNVFMMDKMLYSNYLAKQRAFKVSQREEQAELDVLEITIRTTEDQLKNGVEMKEKKEKKIPVGVN